MAECEGLTEDLPPLPIEGEWYEYQIEVLGLQLQLGGFELAYRLKLNSNDLVLSTVQYSPPSWTIEGAPDFSIATFPGRAGYGGKRKPVRDAAARELYFIL